MDFHSCTKSDDIESLTDIDCLPPDWAKLLQIQSGFVEKYLPKQKKVIEIGCGEGLLLSELLNRNYKVYGIEPSEAASKRAVMRGIEVKNGYFPQQKFNGEFDVVIMSHVLEHIENPSNIINEIVKIAPKGYLLLSQTNYLGLIPRIQKGKWYAWVPEQHFWHFSLHGLSRFLADFGFKQVDYAYSSLVHPHDIWYKIASQKNSWADQFTVLYKLES
ncbi:MAG: class I SAM-dependent methyltransferase [Bacteroidales bacterium]